MIQIPNMPNDLHRRLKSRAAFAGMSLSGYLLKEIRRVAERLTLAELRGLAAPNPGHTNGVPRSSRARRT